jgi:hypothetical protein
VAKVRKEYCPMALCSEGKVIPTMKFPLQLATLPRAMAPGRGPTSNSSEKYVRRYVLKWKYNIHNKTQYIFLSENDASCWPYVA